jgi:hypothetical protein
MNPVFKPEKTFRGSDREAAVTGVVQHYTGYFAIMKL